MTSGARYRGQPVLVLLALLAGWLSIRIVLWQVPFAALAAPAAAAEPARGPEVIWRAPMSGPRGAPRLAVPRPLRPREPLWLGPAELAEPMPPGWALAAVLEPGSAPVRPRAAGQQTQLAASSSNPAKPTERSGLTRRDHPGLAAIPSYPFLGGETARAPAGRWSGDAWLLLRRDTTTPVTSGRGSYGQSQAGAVLRYRLAPSSEHRPAAYVRTSLALADAREAEAALGFAARPVPSIPVTVAVEARAFRSSEVTEARPAVFAYTELPPLELPLGVRGEAYVQGGYVGGRFATAFVDGQVKADRRVVRVGPAELRAGAGAWGGAQEAARRLDVGPGATVALDLGQVPLRVSADWRFRIAGEANPSSGPALTVSTGF